jgi:tetratricopeptide (TPR) repeat protein
VADAPLRIDERFTFEAQVGRGAFGEVYRGVDRQSGQPVAIKRLIGTLGDTIAVERFDREARLVSQISSPYVVRYVAHGVDAEEQPCLVLEWLEGEDLKRRQQWRPLKIVEAVEVVRQVALGLQALHDAGIIHRDVKPSNFYLLASRDEKLHVKIIDLGTARGDGEMALTVEGWAVGTPAYMSPEQARGEQDITPASDVFSLGVVLFELLAGKRPFRGADNYAVLAKIVLEDAPRLAGAVAGVSPELDEIVVRAMAKRAEQRFRSARDMAEALAVATVAAVPLPVAPTDDVPTEMMRATGDDATAPVRIPRVSTLQEQRVVTAVFSSMAMLPSEDSHAAMRAFGTIVTERGGVPHATLGARMIGVFGGARASGDEVVRGAHAALAAQEAVPGVRLAIVTGRVQADVEGVGGEAIERGATMLDADEGDIRIDPPTARMLAGRFIVEGEEGAEVLVGEREIDVLPHTLLGKQTTCVGRDRELAVLEGIWSECVAERVARVALVTAGPGAGKSRLMRELLRRIAASYSPPSPMAPMAGAPSSFQSGLHTPGSFRSGITAPVGRPPGSDGPGSPGRARSGDRGPPSSFRTGPISSGHGPQVLHGRGDSLGAGSPFGMLAPAIRRAARIQGEEPLEVRRQKLRARISRRMPARDATRVAPFLGELAGVPFPDDKDEALRAARADPMVMGDALRSAFCDWLTAESSAAPLLLILDDLHWGDLPSVRFVDVALRQLRDQPMMVLALARPEVHGHFPNLWSERAVHEIRLGPLSKKASEKLAREVLGAEVPDVRVQRIVERAEGNAFYLEELIRAVAEGASDALPDTVLGMVQARLDAVGSDGRRVLRAASVFGSAFTRGGVLALIGGEERAQMVDPCLEDLVTREVIVPRRAAQVSGEPEYGFRHALVREAAYAILTDADRAIGHRLAGEWLELQGNSAAVVLAQHFHLGGQAGRAAGWFRRAAEQAMEGNDLAGAIERAERGVACGAAGEHRGALRLIQAEAHLWRGEVERGEERATEAATALAAATPLWLRAVAQAVEAAGRRGHYDRVASWMDVLGKPSEVADVARQSGDGADSRAAVLAETIVGLARCAAHLADAGRHDLATAAAERLEALAQELEASDAVSAAPAGSSRPDSLPPSVGKLGAAATAALHRTRARTQLRSGDPSGYLGGLAAALHALERGGDARQACSVRAELGDGYAILGASSHAEPTLRQTLATAESMGLTAVTTRALVALSATLSQLGNTDGARRAALRAVEADEPGDNRRMAGLANTRLARLELEARRLHDAERLARDAVDLLEGVPPARAQALATVAAVLCAAGRLDEALATAREAVRAVDALGGLEEGETLVRLAEVDTLEARGEREAARAALGIACARLGVQAMRIRDAAWRVTYVRGVPEHARAMSMGAAWGCAPASWRVAAS